MHSIPNTNLSPESIATVMQLQSLSAENDEYRYRFRSMGSPCEILMRGCTLKAAKAFAQTVVQEVERIEKKYSRYRADSVVTGINRSPGKAVAVDDETARLLDTADALYSHSDGLFDITSGCLRRVWQFDCSDRIPENTEVKSLLKHIGWDKVLWDGSCITLPKAFEIDFGGFGKEYATDCCLRLAAETAIDDVLVNLGGDIACRCTDPQAKPWQIGVESVRQSSEHNAIITLGNGGIATSGDTNKYLEKAGIRYSHVLNPGTGWPVVNAPNSITVVANSCSEAGMISTLAMLQGENAERFLSEQETQYWVQR